MTDKPYSRHLGFRWNAERAQSLFNRVFKDWAEKALFGMRTHFIVGYDPQKLLPAPSPDNRPMSLWTNDAIIQSMTEWAAEAIKKPYMDYQFMPRPYQEAAMRHWTPGQGKVRNPLDDVQRYADYIRDNTGPLDPVLVVGTDFTPLEVRTIWATVSHESAGGAPVPSGRIEMFDYHVEPNYDEIMSDVVRRIADAVGISSVFFQGRQQGKTELFKMKQPPREHASPKRDQGYLQHDPTKRHRRKKR